MKTELVIIVLIASTLSASSQTRPRDERLFIANAFIRDLRSGSLTDEQIMEKYVTEGAYFKSDSVKKIADEVIALMRQALNRLPENNIEFLKYSDHEVEFRVTGVRDIGDPSNTPKERSFYSYGPAKSKIPVDLDKIYAIRGSYQIELKTPDGPKFRTEKFETFLLFDQENKIYSFWPWTTGTVTGFLVF